jgi:hypothetical protein
MNIFFRIGTFFDCAWSRLQAAREGLTGEIPPLYERMNIMSHSARIAALEASIAAITAAAAAASTLSEAAVSAVGDLTKRVDALTTTVGEPDPAVAPAVEPAS